MNLATAPLNPMVVSFFIAPMSEALGVSRTEISWGVTFRLVTVAVVGPVLGLILDRFGARWIGVLAGFIAGGSLLALSSIEHLPMLYFIFAVSGLSGFGGVGGPLLTIVPVGKWFVHRRGRAMAVTLLGSTAGAIIGVQAAEWLIHTFDWRAAWIVFGAFILAVVPLVTALFMRRSPEDHGLEPDAGLHEEADAPTRGTGFVSEDNWTRGQALRSITAWAIVASAVMTHFAVTGTLLHRTAFWHDMGMAPSLVALGTALDPLTVMFSVIFFGFVAERIPIRWIGLLGGLGLALSVVPMLLTHGEAYTIVAHSLTWGLFAGAFVTTNNLIWADYFGRRALGAIQGVVMPLTVASTALAAPAYGYLLDSGLARPTVWAVSLVLFAAGGILLFVTRRPELPLISRLAVNLAPR